MKQYFIIDLYGSNVVTVAKNVTKDEAITIIIDYVRNCSGKCDLEVYEMLP